MAEINIEKKSSPKWPWILLALLIIAALIYFFALAGNDDDLEDQEVIEEVQMDDDKDDDNTYDISQSNNSMDENNTDTFDSTDDYLSYIEANKEMGLGHRYSNNALERLIEATKKQAEMSNVDISADLAQARKDAEEITTDPEQLNHADLIKKSGKSILNALQTIQKSKFPELGDEMSDLIAELEAIKPGTPTLEQKKDVKSFFEKTAQVLTKMRA